jgi:predicted flap endonuclease-1-like 5' DNA nuclease
MQKTRKVTFSLPAEIVADASHGLLLGEFNNWDKDNGFSLKKGKDGSMKATLELEAGKRYEYRYLLDGGRWENDPSANDYAQVHGLDIYNCVVTVPVDEVLLKEKPAPTKTVDAKKKTAPKKSVKDDLTRIEGIGKKIEELLNGEGILTYGDLAKATQKKLKSVLSEAGPKFSMHDPASWPKQSKLAATGLWDELKSLQEKLKGGK